MMNLINFIPGNRLAYGCTQRFYNQRFYKYGAYVTNLFINSNVFIKTSCRLTHFYNNVDYKNVEYNRVSERSSRELAPRCDGIYYL